jgi:class 3 adenylate cyclase/tetratricopeptide (TPR) repeat protein
MDRPPQKLEGDGKQSKGKSLPDERRQLTVVFIDIADSTSLSERLDPEEFFSILRAYRNICDQWIRHFGGCIARMVGDGLLAYFGFPHAREDSTESAVHAALSIAAAIRDQEFSTWEAGSVRLQVRIAVNTGLVVIGSLTGGQSLEQQEVFGTSVHIAARLQSIAPPNGVIIGPSTHDLVSGAFRCVHLGEYQFKGIKGAIPYWRVDGVSSSDSRFERTRSAPLTSMVGRTSECATLMKLWSTAVEGSGGVAVISGEAGIGKSRLIKALRMSIAESSQEVLLFQCSPFHVYTPLAPFIERLRRVAGLSENDSPAEMLAKLKHLLALATSDTEMAIRYYGALLSVPPSANYRPIDLGSSLERKRALETVIAVTTELARRRPLLMIVEDVQWIDPTSIELLERLLPRIVSERILLILTHRSDYDPYWLVGGDVNILRLAKLETLECEQMVRDIARDWSLSRATLRAIVDRTDGIPLFVEEFTRAVLDAGSPTDDRQTTKRRLNEPLVPASRHDSLMERLDRLGDAKRVAQVASILGRQFDYEALLYLVDLPKRDLRRALERLEMADLLYRQRTSPGTTFTFKHALIQDAAYASLLKETRAALHARVASRLRQIISRDDSGQLALLGHHYSRAGMMSEAVTTLLEAGKTALGKSANKEAIANLWTAIELLSKLPRSPEHFQTEIALQSNLAMAYTTFEGWAGPQVDRPYNRALELCRSYGTIREKSIVLWGVAIAKLVSSELERSLELAQEFIQLAHEWKDREASLMAHTAALVANFFLGRLPEALTLAKSVGEQYGPRSQKTLVQIYQHDPKIVALVYAGHIEWLLGHTTNARFCCESARRLAKEIGHPFMLAFALILGAADYLYERDLTANLASVEEGIKVAKEHALGMYGSFGPLWAIPAFTARNPSAATLENLSGLISTLLQHRCYLQAPLYQIYLAGEFGRLGQVERGRVLAASAEALMNQTGERWFEPEIYRVRAILSYQSPNPDYLKADHLFRRAIASAEKLKAAGWELRTAISFAQFLDRQNRRSDARAVLAQARSKFLAAESSVDLREADNLMQEWDSGYVT